MAQKLKLKVLTLITKLSDRDTYKIASTELEKIAGSLDSTTLPAFLSCILSTDANDKPLVRKQCLHLLSTLPALYSNSLSNSLPKILSYITRRLRDPDSSVIRSQCLTAITSLASNITKLPFSTAFLKQLSESVFTEQELNAQIGSALCLAAAIDAAPDPEPGRLGKVLVPRLERLVRSEGYKARFAGLVVVGSVIAVGGVSGIGGGIGGLVKCLVGFLSSEDWNSRKAAAEALRKLAVVERDGVAEFKSECLKVFENRRFDKVKAAREVMNETIEAWKQVPDVSEEASPPPRSLASSRDASDKRHWSGSKNSCAAGSEATQMGKKSVLAIRTTPPDGSLAATARKRSPLKSTEKKVDGSDFVENGLDPELCFGISFRKIGAGLENLGNTCFLNSVLQCLTYTEPLAAYLQSGKHQNSCHVAGFCALCAIQKHVSRALQSSGRSLVPKDLVSNLRCISRNFRNARQEDAHEYMVNLLESMHKCCLPSGVPSESPAAYEKSLVHKIFGGHLRSQVECQQCSYCSNKFDPFLDLSLEIAKADTLPVALRNFTAAEVLDGGEKQYQCQRCKQKVRAKKRLTVHKAPHVLTIHLKRFHAHDPGRKVDKKVIFDRSLDIKPFVSGSYEGDLKYSLYGVLVHYGHNTHSGHYVCFVRTSSNMWHLLNDNQVRQVSEKTVLEQKAYMLFYVRDRKNFVARKPDDVVKKESMKANLGNTFANLVAKQFSKEHVDSGLIGNRLESTNSSAAVNTKDASSTDTPSEIYPKDALFQQNNRQKLPKVHPASETSSAPLTIPSKGVYLANSELRECLPPSTPSMNSNNVAPKPEETSNITEAKTGDCNVPSDSSSCLKNSAIDKLVRNEISQKINAGLNVGVSSQVPCWDFCDKTSGEVPRLAPSMGSTDQTFDKTVTVKSPNKPSCESDQGGDIPIKSSAGKTPSGKAVEGGQQTAHQSVEASILIASIPPVIQNECLHSKAPACTPKKKLEKKLLKRRMHLGSNLFRVSLGVHMRKKHKKRKCLALETNNLFKENLLEQLENDGCSSRLGPSTSRISAVLLASMTSRRKTAKSGSRKGNDTRKSSDPGMGVIDGESMERNSPSGTLLTMDKQRQKSSTSISEVNGGDAREPDCTENSKRYASQNGIMNALGGGSKVTVAPWDGIELPPQIVESNGVENLSIGYVANEWDEEYDRGKRKKLRQSQHNFDGPNLFQALATEKTQVKKAKMDRSRSGNQPFRI